MEFFLNSCLEDPDLIKIHYLNVRFSTELSSKIYKFF